MILLDTNVLLRHARADDPCYPLADAAVAALAERGAALRTVPQNLYEFWAVATRPAAANGLGLSPVECASALARLRVLFPLLPDPPGLPAAWEALVVAHDCRGKVAHDARLVAAMRLHGIPALLTFNDADFRRYPGITVLTPAGVLDAR